MDIADEVEPVVGRRERARGRAGRGGVECRHGRILGATIQRLQARASQGLLRHVSICYKADAFQQRGRKNRPYPATIGATRAKIGPVHA